MADEQLEDFPAATLLCARVCRLLLLFFIIFCVLGLISGWLFEGDMTLMEEVGGSFAENSFRIPAKSAGQIDILCSVIYTGRHAVLKFKSFSTFVVAAHNATDFASWNRKFTGNRAHVWTALFSDETAR